MRIAGGATVCSGHRSLSLPYSTRSRPTSTQSQLIWRRRSSSRTNGSAKVFLQANKRKLVLLSPLRAAESDSSSTQTALSVEIPNNNYNKTLISDDGFSLSKVSFYSLSEVYPFGFEFYSYGFGAYFNVLPGSEWSAIMLTYGFPLAIIGMALKYAELKPVPCLTYSDAQSLSEKCATPILKQVKSDVTRFRYGDEQHLDEALKRIFQYGQGGGIPRRSAPVLHMIREEVTDDGKYSLVLVFEAKALQLSDFEQRQAKFASFFGPGITAEVGKGEKDLYEVRLISNTDPKSSSS
ncbi:uncharacterized protein [Arachis hypogaea]|uniref:uncharacterized protein isoform X1 n=1 Tax=Arachis hypogaea TaxID=3818 RepID=UPI003B213D66